MRLFLRHYGGQGVSVPDTGPKSSSERFEAEANAAAEIVCDEEEIDRT
jgi:hypothetical protein